MNYEKYLIKKGKLDLLSSLKALDKKLLNKALKDSGMDSIEELKDGILEEFEMSLDMSKDDSFTRLYFERLLAHENSEWMSAYQQDIEDFLVFVYKNGDYYSYYIPTEIKEIIKRLLGSMTKEEKFNLENAANTPIVKDLKGLLETLNVSDLKHIGGLLHVNRLSHKPKKELVKIVYDALTDKDKLTDVIERFVDKEFNLLKDLIVNKGTIQDNNINIETYHFLYMVGIVFLFRRDNKFYISMTDDVYNVIKKIDLNNIQKIVDENTKVYNLVRSMVELYGVFSYSYLDYYYSLYYGNGEELDAPNNALLFCERADNIDIIHTQHNMYFVHKILMHRDLESLLDDIVSRQRSVKRKPIELKELLKYCNYDYYEETDAKNKFKKYLKDKNVTSDIIETIIKIISDMYRLGNSYINATFEMLHDYGVEITEENMQEILDYLMDIYNNSRIWTNNGWTPIEMRKNYNEVFIKNSDNEDDYE